MDIEALVKKHVRLYRAGAHYSVRVAMRAALTEFASEYENDKTLRLVAVNREVTELNERIRQLEQERVPLADVAKATQLLKNERDDEAYALLVEILEATQAQEKVAATYTGPSSTACDDQFAATIEDDMS